MGSANSLRAMVLAGGAELGFDLVGIAGVAPSSRLALFGDWVESGRAGEMGYLARKSEAGRYLRASVTEAWPWARSVLCAAVVFNTGHARSTDLAGDRDRGWISRYAWGDDYHDVLRSKLEAWVERLRELAPDGNTAQFKITVDTAPLVEREAARAAGLGWQAKNTCLIHPQLGSYFFLGCVITSLDLDESEPLPDRCGSCRRCIEACPTQALGEYTMDASQCLAYFNIELRGAIPEEFRPAMGANVLGCDICQDVCPWNRKAAVTAAPEFQPRPGLVAPPLAELAQMTEADYRERFRHSAVKRAKYSGLMRNVAVAMGNSGNPAHLPILQQWTANDDPNLAEHASWAMRHIEEQYEADLDVGRNHDGGVGVERGGR